MMKKRFFPIFVFFLFSILVPAWIKAQPVKTAGRVGEIQGRIPQPENNYVNDYAKLLKPEDADYIKWKLERVEKQTGIEISVITVSRMADYQHSNPEALARAFFNAWGVGNVKQNDGIVVLVAHKDRQMAIEVGDGWGKRLKEPLGGIIRNDFAPHFKADRYSAGILEGTDALVKLVTRPLAWYEYWWVKALFFAALAVFFFFVAVSFFKDGQNGWGYVFLAIALSFLWFMISALLSGRSKGSSSSFGGGFSSGGGGASGSW